MTSLIDPECCPICGGPNRCGDINPENRIDNRCWCATETFPRGIFELVPEHMLNKACICKTCLDRYKSGELTRRTISPLTEKNNEL